MNKNERTNRVLARGEMSNHSHVIIGDDVDIERNTNGEIIITIGNEDAVLKHILESDWVEHEQQKWSEEHLDISLKGFPAQVRQGDVMLEKVADSKYKLVIQRELNPYEKAIQQVKD